MKSSLEDKVVLILSWLTSTRFVVLVRAEYQQGTFLCSHDLHAVYTGLQEVLLLVALTTWDHYSAVC